MATKTKLTEAEVAAWRALLSGHSRVTRLLDAELTAECGQSLGSYEVLLLLASAPDRRLRMTDLAERAFLSRSGITRLVDRLVAEGLVSRERCAGDARVTYAAITAEGQDRLRLAAPVHLRGVREHVTGQFSDAELDTLATLLGRIADPLTGAEPDCSV